MSEAEETAPDYHLLLDPEEVPAAASALRLYLGDEAHQPEIQAIGREVMAGLEGEPGERGVLSLPLSARQMKIVFFSVRLLINDLQREQAGEREILWRILEKLPDEHVMRAIELRAEPDSVCRRAAAGSTRPSEAPSAAPVSWRRGRSDSSMATPLRAAAAAALILGLTATSAHAAPPAS